MIFFIIFGFVAASAEDLVNVHMGSFDAVARVGEIPFKYKKLEAADLVATVNSKRWMVRFFPHIIKGTPLIPPQDPYIKERLRPIYLNGSGHIYVRYFATKGLRNAELHSMEIRLKNNRVDATYYVPFLEVDVDYKATLQVDPEPRVYEGHAKIMMENVIVQITTKPSQINHIGVQVYQVSAVELAVHADNLELIIGEDMLDVVNEHMDHVIQQSMDMKVKEMMSDMNEILKQIPATEVLENVYGTYSPFNYLYKYLKQIHDERWTKFDEMGNIRE